ncbi:MAG: cell division protein SepF [Candidatus Altiarchaeota archaeon]|nr:cell division protein SepF [Candidatus Altiarchaeota archaeon]
MGVKSWLGFEEEEEAVDLEEYLEGIGLHEGEMLDEDKYTYVKSINANSPEVISDAERELKKGNIIILDTEALAQTNRLSLKKLITDLKALENEIDGDMGRISETKILFVPSGFRLLKRKFE